MPDTALRHVRMLMKVPRHPRKISTGELADYLEQEGFSVTKRTVERDLDKLSGTFPITHDEANPRGWHWPQEAAGLELPAMSPATALAFQILDEFSRPLLPNNLHSFLDQHMHRARKVLAEVGDQKPGMREWSKLVAVAPRSQPLLPPKGDPEAARVAYDALLQQRQMEAKYDSRSAEKPPDRYRINPLGIVLRNNILYLVATLFDYEDTRVLALHRMSEAVLLDEPNRVPEGFELQDYVEAGELDIREGEDIRLVARFKTDAATHLHETPLGKDQRIEALDENECRVSATVQNTRQLRWWLLGFGGAVRVEAPEVLRDEIANTAQAMAEQYGVVSEPS